jgi:purine-binding chemotaxis protein CheW
VTGPRANAPRPPEPQPQDDRTILEARARALARRMDDLAPQIGVEMLSFSLAREQFAVPSRYVFAVFPLAELVPLPGATPPVVGLTRWRGDVLTILDLRRLIANVHGALDDLSRVIVIGDTYPQFGILADVVRDMIMIDLAALHRVPDERRGDTRMLLGITQDAIHVIDAPALMARQADVHATTDTVVQTPSPSAQ